MKNMRAVYNNRLVRLAKFLRTLPEAKFDYTSYFNGDWITPNCRTTACALGWAATMPEFKDLGVGFHAYRDFPGATFTWNGQSVLGTTVAKNLFGLDGPRREALFASGQCLYQGQHLVLLSLERTASAKQVANRILKFVRLRREGVIS